MSSTHKSMNFLNTGANQTSYLIDFNEDTLCDILIVGGGGGGGAGNEDTKREEEEVVVLFLWLIKYSKREHILLVQVQMAEMVLIVL